MCWDNAAAESFLGTLKTELVNRNNYRNRHHTRLSIRYWIEASSLQRADDRLGGGRVSPRMTILHASPLRISESVSRYQGPLDPELDPLRPLSDHTATLPEPVGTRLRTDEPHKPGIPIPPTELEWATGLGLRTCPRLP